jgi:hypothetical protein
VTTPVGSYLMIRTLISNQKWMLLYPLLGNPLKGKGRSVQCGYSGRAPAEYLLKKGLVLVGEGNCNLAKATLGLRPRLCISSVKVPQHAPLWFFQKGRRHMVPSGNLLLGTKLYALRRRAKAKDGESLFSLLQKSPPPTQDLHKKRWTSLQRKGKINEDGIWQYGGRSIDPSNLKIPVVTTGAIRILRDKKHVRIVFRTKMLKFERVGNQLKRVGAPFVFGKNVKATYATFGQLGHILILVTEKKAVYQLSEKP